MRWQVILAAVVIFLAGIATGALATRALTPAPAARPSAPLPLGLDRRHAYLERLDREVDLTPEQRLQVEKIIAASQERIRALWEPIAPEAREAYRAARREIAALLTPAQKARLEEARQKRRHRTTSAPQEPRSTQEMP